MNTKRKTYYWVFIAVSTLISSIALFQYAKLLPELISQDQLFKEIGMCSGQILWQGSIVWVFIQKEITPYLYQMITVSLLGSLALFPIIIGNTYTKIPLEIRVLYFLLVVFCMILEHYRRVKKLNLPTYLTVTWVAYRILWLPLLLY